MFVENNKLNNNGIALIRIIISAILFVVGEVLSFTVSAKSEYVWLAIFIPAYLCVGYDVVYTALGNIIRGKVFDENFLMTISTVGAFVIAEYPEAVAVMLFYQVGELFQRLATDRSRKNIAELMNIRPDYANLLVDGEVRIVDPYDVKVNDSILIKVGERVPLDCVIIEGESTIDNSALTGESLPQEVGVGSSLLSGSINKTAVIKARVNKEFSESTVCRILDLVENATDNKSKQEQFITRFAKYYTPTVVILAILLAIIPSVITGEWYAWVYRALTFLVVSCPCALVISVPLSFFAGIGVASKNGVLIKGSNYLEMMANADIIALDKTGTITEGSFDVSEINAVGCSEDELLEISALAESHSLHPIAISLRNKCRKELDLSTVSDIKELAGYGVECVINGRKVLVGNRKLMLENDIKIDKNTSIGTVCYVAVDGKFCGSIVVGDKIKENSKNAIVKIKELGVKKIIMLTGDNAMVANDIASSVGVDEVYSGLLPVDKVEIVERIESEISNNGKLIFVGDGINDAPVLARADIGIAMGGIGSDSAVQASDIVLMHDDLDKIGDTIKLAKRTRRIVIQNIVFTLIIKFAVLVLSAFGLANMWLAVFADVGVSVLAILNAMRLFRNNK